MKLAILSDVHGNLPATEAVVDDLLAWQPDLLVANGDLVSRGAFSREVLVILRDAFPDTIWLKGNHESFVLEQWASPFEPDHPRYDFARFAQWSARQVSPMLDWLGSWPHQYRLPSPRGAVVITHASLHSNREGVSARTTPALLRGRVDLAAGVFVASHTHCPLVLPYGPTLVVNCGSVGTPLDGDGRACYARLTLLNTGWRVTLRRVPFDRQRMLADLVRSGFMESAGPLGCLIEAEYRHCRSLVGPWMHRYHDCIIAGQMSVSAAVRHWLAGGNT